MNRKISEIRIEGNTAYVSLSQGQEAIIDAQDISKIEGYSWHALKARKTFYAKAAIKDDQGNIATVYMHRIILDAPRGMEVDHKDMNGLNNRRENLRVCTPSQNRCNNGLSKSNSSGFKGVDWRRGKWRARIQKNGKKIDLGSFDCIHDAAAAYEKAAKDIHGEFSRGAVLGKTLPQMKGGVMPFALRPEILSMPNIPKPLHGLNPRSIMGKERWDKKRQEVYASTQYHCAACGVHKSRARRHKRLEAHELFEIDYQKARAFLVEIVPLCHFCHAFIHSGLTRVRARKKEITAQEVREILNHGCSVLRQSSAPMFIGTSQLCELVGVDCSDIDIQSAPSKIGNWSDWRMVWEGKEYRGKFKTFQDWARHYK